MNLVVATSHGQWPVVLGDTAPENPDRSNREQRKERFKQGAVYFSIRSLTQMSADHILEDLADGKQQASSGQID